MKDETRKRIKEDLKESAAKYADHVENTISKLQLAYLKEHNPLEYSHSTEVLQRPEDDRSKRFGGKISALFRGWREDVREPELAKPIKSEEGIANITLEFKVNLLSQPSELVSSDDCRSAVGRLNEFRSMRIENLRDGYDVSGICDDIDSRYIITNPVS